MVDDRLLSYWYWERKRRLRELKRTAHSVPRVPRGAAPDDIATSSGHRPVLRLVADDAAIRQSR